MDINLTLTEDEVKQIHSCIGVTIYTEEKVDEHYNPGLILKLKELQGKIKNQCPEGVIRGN